MSARSTPWSQWEIAEHIDAAQALCEQAQAAATDDEYASTSFELARVHAMIAVAGTVDRLANILNQRLPAAPHD